MANETIEMGVDLALGRDRTGKLALIAQTLSEDPRAKALKSFEQGKYPPKTKPKRIERYQVWREAMSAVVFVVESLSEGRVVLSSTFGNVCVAASADLLHRGCWNFLGYMNPERIAVGQTWVGNIHRGWTGQGDKPTMIELLKELPGGWFSVLFVGDEPSPCEKKIHHDTILRHTMYAGICPDEPVLARPTDIIQGQRWRYGSVNEGTHIVTVVGELVGGFIVQTDSGEVKLHPREAFDGWEYIDTVEVKKPRRIATGQRWRIGTKIFEVQENASGSTHIWHVKVTDDAVTLGGSQYAQHQTILTSEDLYAAEYVGWAKNDPVPPEPATDLKGRALWEATVNLKHFANGAEQPKPDVVRVGQVWALAGVGVAVVERATGPGSFLLRDGYGNPLSSTQAGLKTSQQWRFIAEDATTINPQRSQPVEGTKTPREESRPTELQVHQHWRSPVSGKELAVVARTFVDGMWLLETSDGARHPYMAREILAPANGWKYVGRTEPAKPAPIARFGDVVLPMARSIFTRNSADNLVEIRVDCDINPEEFRALVAYAHRGEVADLHLSTGSSFCARCVRVEKGHGSYQVTFDAVMPKDGRWHIHHPDPLKDLAEMAVVSGQRAGKDRLGIASLLPAVEALQARAIGIARHDAFTGEIVGIDVTPQTLRQAEGRPLQTYKKAASREERLLAAEERRALAKQLAERLVATPPPWAYPGAWRCAVLAAFEGGYLEPQEHHDFPTTLVAVTKDYHERRLRGQTHTTAFEAILKEQSDRGTSKMLLTQDVLKAYARGAGTPGLLQRPRANSGSEPAAIIRLQ